MNRRQAIGALATVFGSAAVTLAMPRPAAATQFEPGRSLVGLPRQDFRPPAPGSYKLPAIQSAPSGWVLEGNRLPRPLSNYTHDAITLLSFVYTYCTDPAGCPLAYAAMLEVRERTRREARLREQARLVSLSFDPTHDTPQAMQAYGGENARARAPRWHFITTSSIGRLTPILQGFGQDAEVQRDDGGQPMRVISHVLKLFLIDRRARVREIYSAAFLMPEVIVNDMLTLALESAAGVR